MFPYSSSSIFSTLLHVLPVTTLLWLLLLQPVQAQGCTHYVAPAPAGSNTTGNGSNGSPWATITYAVDNTDDGCTILVKPGTYEGQVQLDRIFTQGITVRSQVPYQARLRHDGTTVRAWYGQKITLEGFDIAHEGPGASALVIQIQDLLGDHNGNNGGTDPQVRDITLRNNVIHDSFNNDILKINNGAGHITVEGNIFYNQTGSDEHMDVNSVTDVVIRDNIFFNDFAGSGRPVGSTSAFVVIKDSNGTDDTVLGSERVTVRRNVFLNWEGSPGYGFVQIGEDGTDNYEARDILLENNLMLGNSGDEMRAPLAVMNSEDITFRHNTVVGNLPSDGFAMRLYICCSDDKPRPRNIRFYNNIWSDPTGTMGRFAMTPLGETESFTLRHNLYWNGGAALPHDPDEEVNINDDPEPIIANPVLGNQGGLVIPRWNQGSGQFADGSTTIRQAFERLVELYGTPGPGSGALGAADASQSPNDDILGASRGATPNLGASEGSFALSLNPASRQIEPGAVTTYQLQVTGSANNTVNLSATDSSPQVVVSLSSTSLTPPGQVILTVTSNHPADFSSGETVNISVAGASQGVTKTAKATLVVGGERAYLPLIVKN